MTYRRLERFAVLPGRTRPSVDDDDMCARRVHQRMGNQNGNDDTGETDRGKWALTGGRGDLSFAFTVAA